MCRRALSVAGSPSKYRLSSIFVFCQRVNRVRPGNLTQPARPPFS
jgi:hypothetical protein